MNHHVLMFSQNVMGQEKTVENEDGNIDSGYVHTDFYQTILPKYSTAIKTVFGENHMLAHNELLSTSTNLAYKNCIAPDITGTSSNSAWQSDIYVNIFNENMLFGTQIKGSSTYDICNCIQQVAAMRLFQEKTISDLPYWTRSMYSPTQFVIMAQAMGDIYFRKANVECGIRPYFLLK